jgi:hypothetical protein
MPTDVRSKSDLIQPKNGQCSIHSDLKQPERAKIFDSNSDLIQPPGSRLDPNSDPV